jgi:hypothetical protein
VAANSGEQAGMRSFWNVRAAFTLTIGVASTSAMLPVVPAVDGVMPLRGIYYALRFIVQLLMA